MQGASGRLIIPERNDAPRAALKDIFLWVPVKFSRKSELNCPENLKFPDMITTLYSRLRKVRDTVHIGYFYLNFTARSQISGGLSFLCLAFLLLGTPPFVSAQPLTAIASCCSGNTATCTGASYCKACKNCSSCAHCNRGGGSCGVCSRKQSPSSPSPTKKTMENVQRPEGSFRTGFNRNRYDNPDTRSDESSWLHNKTLLVRIKILNLREGPDTTYPVIETLVEKQELVFLARENDWIRVRVKASGTMGYVHSRYVVLVL